MRGPPLPEDGGEAGADPSRHSQRRVCLCAVRCVASGLSMIGSERGYYLCALAARMNE